jgi:hypothetical protein
MKIPKPVATMPWIASTRARNVCGSSAPNTATAAPNSARMRIQSSIEPSWFPQTPVIL